MFALAAETIGLIGVCITAAASIAAAYVSHRTRQENSQQHGASQQLLSNVAMKVDEHGRKIDKVVDRLDTVAERVDHAHTRIDNHKRRWFR